MRALLLLFMIATTVSAQQDFAPPGPFPPDAATLTAIKAKTEELATQLEGLKQSPAYRDIEIYHKAAVWIVRHNEWLTKESGKQTLTVLDAGLLRAKTATTASWLTQRGRPIIRGYWSPIDGSVQPYSVTYPKGFLEDGKEYLVEVHLHGRDATLTEVKFIASRETAKESNPDRVIVDVYGRGNNGYRWAGEEDVARVLWLVAGKNTSVPPMTPKGLDDREPILRGFSMGGGGTWSYGLHHPFALSALQPGAGFTLTRGHAGKSFPEQLPDYQERTLRIYDVANCAENLANIPCVAYSGDKDPQIRAARNIEAALKDFKLPLKFEHIVAPGLEHKMPPEWKVKVDAKLAELLPKDATPPERVHYVTYTTAYPDFRQGRILGLERQYERSVVDVESDAASMTVKTTNVSRIQLLTAIAGAAAKPQPGAAPVARPAKTLVLDGQSMPAGKQFFAKVDGKWQVEDPTTNFVDPTKPTPLRKKPRCQGPIDDAFMGAFEIVPGKGTPWNAAIHAGTDAVRAEFVRVWDKYLRGDLTASPAVARASQVYFGDPGSNPRLAAILKDLPITWSKDSLVVNGVTYDAKTHYPVMIYPKREPVENETRDYHVINTGHTFGEDAFKGSNVMLYPRLGDWAVMKLAPTKANPHATEVVAAGIFDANWQFEKK